MTTSLFENSNSPENNQGPQPGDKLNNGGGEGQHPLDTDNTSAADVGAGHSESQEEPAAANLEADDAVDLEAGTPPEAIDVVEPTPSSDSESDSEDASLTATELMAELAAFRGEMAQHLSQMHHALQENRHQVEVFDQLHAELQTHRKGFEHTLLSPLFHDLLRLYDHFEQSSAAQSDEQQSSNAYQFAIDLIEETLGRHGVESYASQENGEIDRKRHNVISTQPTSNQELNKKIATLGRKGFVYQGKVMRHEQVVAWKFEPMQEEATSTDVQESSQMFEKEN